MKFFEPVKKTVRNNKKATAAYTLAAIFVLVGAILLKESGKKSTIESAGASLIMLAVLIAMGTFFSQKCCPNACVRKNKEQLVLERVASVKYGTINEEDNERDEQVGTCCAAL